MRGRPSAACERGIALIAVLWVVALASALAVGLASISRQETDLARNVVDRLQAQHLAEAGIHLGIATLIAGPAAAACFDGRPRALTLAHVPLAVAITDEGGKVDLNEAPLPLLAGLFRSAGAADGEAAALADAVADWRDRDAERRPLGAENEDYRRAGAGYDAKDAPFETTAELAAVRGVTAALMDRLHGLITVRSHAPGIDPTVAPAAALAAVPGYGPELAREYVELRARLPGCGALPPPPLAEAQPYLVPSAKVAFAIQARATGEAGTTVRREAVVGLHFRPDRPVLFLDWRTLSAAE
jgi:general secretion pathway protein K